MWSLYTFLIVQTILFLVGVFILFYYAKKGNDQNEKKGIPKLIKFYSGILILWFMITLFIATYQL